ncbi:MAG: HAD family hydrolase [Pseudomonadota bacterium]|nr:HAD family hydrolase [Pseudomonadota bacterium]
MKIDGILFDKDGTLFDFRATWDAWAAKLIDELSEGNADLAAAIAHHIAFDLPTAQFRPESPVIAGTGREAAECVARAMPGVDLDALEARMNASAAAAPLAPAVPLSPLLQSLAAQRLSLGVMTNDSEMGAKAHLRGAGIYELFDFVAGFDSGYGAKPDAAPLLAFSGQMKLAPARVAMVGDSAHDLIAGRAAGMVTVGVLTGIAEAADLAPLADVVLPDIGHLPEWLNSASN